MNFDLADISFDNVFKNLIKSMQPKQPYRIEVIEEALIIFIDVPMNHASIKIYDEKLNIVKGSHTPAERTFFHFSFYLRLDNLLPGMYTVDVSIDDKIYANQIRKT